MQHDRTAHRSSPVRRSIFGHVRAARRIRNSPHTEPQMHGAGWWSDVRNSLHRRTARPQQGTTAERKVRRLGCVLPRCGGRLGYSHRTLVNLQGQLLFAKKSGAFTRAEQACGTRVLAMNRRPQLCIAAAVLFCDARCSERRSTKTPLQIRGFVRGEFEISEPTRASVAIFGISPRPGAQTTAANSVFICRPLN